MKMTRFDIGGGLGARSVRPVLVFSNEEKFNDFIDGLYEVRVDFEAAAKAGDSGAAGDTNELIDPDKSGYSLHLIVDTGVSATATVGVIRVAPLDLNH